MLSYMYTLFLRVHQALDIFVFKIFWFNVTILCVSYISLS